METRNANKLGTMPIGRLLFGMSVPLMISMLVQSLYNIVDGIYVSRISENALTATTLAFPIQMLMIAVATGTGVGINALLSRRLGQKRFGEANSVAVHGIFLAVCSAALFLVFGLFATRPFLSAFCDNPEILEMSVGYLTICAVFSIGIFIEVTCERLLQCTGRTMLSMVCQLTGAAINIILDPILIFGRYGFPQMGIRGAAIATVVGQIVAGIVALIFNLAANKEIKLNFREFRPDRKSIFDIYKVGLPTIIMQALFSVMLSGLNAILIVFSATHVSVLGIYFKLQSFIFMPVLGLTQGLIPILGYNYGAKNAARIKRAVSLSIIVSLIIMLFGTLVFQLVPDMLLRMFDAEENMMNIGRYALRIISICFMLSGVSFVLISVFQGLGNGFISLFNALLRQLIVLLPVAYVLANYVSPDAVWYAFTIADAVSLIVLSSLYFFTYKKKIKPLEILEHSKQSAT